MSNCPAKRTRADFCPGAMRLHEAADGFLARIRAPGGRISAAALVSLSDAADALGDGRLELTSRANIQIRGLSASAAGELAERLVDAGLLPSPSHERVRNIIASPLSGLDGHGSADVTDLVSDLDRALCDHERLTELPGRFLFAIDDGRGDTRASDADIRLTALPHGETHVWPGDFAVAQYGAVPAALSLAESFLDVRGADSPERERAAWRIRELDDGIERVARRARTLLADRGIAHSRSVLNDPPVAIPPIGVVGQRDGGYSVVVMPPLGRVDAGQARAIAALCGRRGLRVTPWRTIVVTDVVDVELAASTAEAAGLGVGAASPWFGVSSCAGRPGCAKALADVQADARVVSLRLEGGSSLPVHWSGCDRRCGRPRGEVVDVLATQTGYSVSDASGRIRSVAHHTDLDSVAEAVKGIQEST